MIKCNTKIYKTLQKSFIFALIIIAFSSALKAQPDIDKIREEVPDMIGGANMGSEFWITIPPNIDLSNGQNNYVRIYCSSPYNANVTVEVKSKGFKKSLSLAPGVVGQFEIDPNYAQCYVKDKYGEPSPDFVYEKDGARIYSDYPIIVYVAVDYEYAADAFLALPVSSLGREYIVSSYPDCADYYNFKSLPSLCGIVATEDATNVEFTLPENAPEATAGGLQPGETKTAVLNQGDVWMFSSAGAGADLSGSRIKSDKPVAVISGNQCANVPPNNPYCNYNVEMDFPVRAWGGKYLAFSIKDRKYSSILRIYAQDEETVVKRNGDFFATLNGGAGDVFHETRIDSAKRGSAAFESDKPIAVSLFNTGAYEDSIPQPNSSPMQMNLTPLEQFGRELFISIPDFSDAGKFAKNYLAIVYPLDDNGEIPLSLELARVYDIAENWRKVRYINMGEDEEVFDYDVDGKRYGVKTMTIEAGVYKIRCDEAVAAYFYGNIGEASYGFPASAFVKNLIVDDSLPPDPQWTLECGEVRDGAGFVADMPEAEESRANLGAVYFFADESDNYIFEHEKFTPGVSRGTSWSLKLEDRSKKARATINFTDANGSDTTIFIEYFPEKVNLAPAAWRFGNLVIGDSAFKILSLVNESENPVCIEKIYLKSIDKYFLIENIDEFTLETGETRKIPVSFVAKTDGAFVDTVVVETCCGREAASEISADVGAPEIFVSDADFGEAIIGQGVQREIEIANTGITDLIITGFYGPKNINFKPHFPAEILAISEDNPLVMKADDEPIRFVVEFAPDEPGYFTDRIIFFNNAQRVDSIAELRGSSRKRGLVANSYDWGRKTIDRPRFPVEPYPPETPAAVVTLKNISEQVIRIKGFDVLNATNEDAFIFNRDTLSMLFINPGDSAIVPCLFHPKTTGNCELTLQYNYTDGINPDVQSDAQTVLRGVGGVPKIKVEPADFDSVAAGEQTSIANRKMRIENEAWEFASELILFGLEPLDERVRDDMKEYGESGFKYAGDRIDYPVKIASGAALEIDAEFMPPDLGEWQAQVVTVSNADEEAVVDFRGFGVEAGLRVFGDRAVICPGGSDTIRCEIENIGPKDVRIDRIGVEPYSAKFKFAKPELVEGFVAPSKEKTPVDIVFHTFEPGVENADLVVASSEFSNSISKAEISGSAEMIERGTSLSVEGETMKIGRDLRLSLNLSPGISLSNAEIDKIKVEIRYNPDFLRIDESSINLGESLAAGAFAIEDVEVDARAGETIFYIAGKEGEFIEGAGELARIVFETFLPNEVVLTTNIEHSIEIVHRKNVQCVDFVPEKTEIDVEPICEYNLRLIEVSKDKYKLYDISPNPVTKPVFPVRFSIAFNGATKAEIYNSAGSLVQTVVDSELKAGEYEINADASALGSGVYVCKLTAGHYVETKKFVVVK